MKYTPFIGMEVHVELKTQSKMFCGCPAEHFNVKPNTHTCPVCLGFPGALPVPNKKAIDWAILIGLALGCRVNHESKFDRKHYFYPDLPKGYQISQYDQPLCVNGKLNLSTSEESVSSGNKPRSATSEVTPKSIRINRVHIEEDTGKLIHATVNGEKVSLVDFNRSGVPLVEIVTEPDLHSASDAKQYVKTIHQLVRYLGVSDCDMEKGSMRLEANISVGEIRNPQYQSVRGNQKSEIRNKKIHQLPITPSTSLRASNYQLPSYKVEVKNLNSFRFLERAIDYEISRQINLLESGKVPVQETRGWSERQGQTLSQRSKEEAQDYRYFPEPDIPPLVFTSRDIQAVKKQLPELPQVKKSRFISTYKLNPQVAAVLTDTRELADYFEQAAKDGAKVSLSADKIANVIVNKHLDTRKYLPAKLIKMMLKKTQSKVSETAQLESWVMQALSQNPKAVADYQKGKTAALTFLIGQVQRQAKGQADVSKVRELLQNQLK